MSRRRIMSWCGIGLLVGAMATPAAGETTIDFETPSLAGALARIINPYGAEGVSFTAVPIPPFTGEVVGLAINAWTSACVPSSSPFDQKLGTGATSNGDNSVGLGGFPIRATFPDTPGSVITMVSVDIQTAAGATVTLRLFNGLGDLVGLATDLALPADGTCVEGRAPSATKRLAATALEPIRHAEMDVDGPYVFVVDRFTFDGGAVPVVQRSWGRLKALYR